MAAADKPLGAGDSHVHWLEKFVASLPGASALFVPGPGRCWKAWIAKLHHGATVASMQRNRGLYRESEAELHQIVVLSAGGNDIDLAGPGAPPTLEVGMALYDYAQVIMLQLHLLFARWRHCMLPHRWLRQVKPDNAMEVLKILKCTQTVLNMAEGGINWRGYDESFRAMRGMEC